MLVPARRSPPGFTLIELILVLAVLAAVLAVSTPSLKRFFRGRSLDAEAYRLMALSRHAQNRAVSEGIPMILWLDPDGRRYGLTADPAWSIAAGGSLAGNLNTLPFDNPTVARSMKQDDPRSMEFTLSEDVEMEVEPALTRNFVGTLEIQENTSPSSRTLLRFQPDGFLPARGPLWILIRHREAVDRRSEETERLWVAPGLNRMAYEIWTNQPPVDRG